MHRPVRDDGGNQTHLSPGRSQPLGFERMTKAEWLPISPTRLMAEVEFVIWSVRFRWADEMLAEKHCGVLGGSAGEVRDLESARKTRGNDHTLVACSAGGREESTFP